MAQFFIHAKDRNMIKAKAVGIMATNINLELQDIWKEYQIAVDTFFSINRSRKQTAINQMKPLK